jgi:hypothetical protein
MGAMSSGRASSAVAAWPGSTPMSWTSPDEDGDVDLVDRIVGDEGVTGGDVPAPGEEVEHLAEPTVVVVDRCAVHDSWGRSVRWPASAC